MSFSFAGAGPKAETIRQLRSHRHEPEGLADQVRNLIVAALEADTSVPSELGGGYIYLAEASGHSGGGGCTSLDIHIRPVWVPSLAPPAPAEAIGVDQHDLEIPDRPTMVEGVDF